MHFHQRLDQRQAQALHRAAAEWLAADTLRAALRGVTVTTSPDLTRQWHEGVLA
ncbi:MAG: hypothetical protein KA764_15505 [Anaerolineales bacterium]|nr:hypothetical protein [Anaerolineales bacterium]